MGHKHSTGAIPTPQNKLETYERYLPITYKAIGELPETFDLRNRIGRVRNQCCQNACVGEAGAVFMTFHRNLQAQNSTNTILMSPQFLYNCRSNFPQSGMYLTDLENIMKTYGDCEEKSYPYGFKTEALKDISSNIIDSAKQNKILSGYRITGGFDDLKQALMENGPCVIVFRCYNHGSRFWKQQPKQSLIGFHALAVVGWNKDGFILRNSWGSLWGTNGCTTFPYSDWANIVELWTYQFNSSS